MKKSGLFLLLLWAALLAGCALNSGPSASSGPNVQTDWSVLEDDPTPLPDIRSRWYPEYMDHLLPRDDYGPLAPFQGASSYYTWAEYPWLTPLMGLITSNGKVVMDPVCGSIRALTYYDEENLPHELPVYALERGDPEHGDPNSGVLIALAASDGSWVTPFQYWGCVPYPGGILAGDAAYLYRIDGQTGQTISTWSKADLGLTNISLPWFTGDAYETVQWTGTQFFLGTDWETGEEALARFFDPAAGVVTTTTAQEWYDFQEYKSKQSAYWETQTSEDGTTVTITHGEEQYRFTSPLPDDPTPYVAYGKRVVFNGHDTLCCAVTDLEGHVILPVQDGESSVLTNSESRILAVSSEDRKAWTIYSWDGELLFTLTSPERSWCSLAGPLLELRGESYTAYYDLEHGTCVFRTWFALGDRPADKEVPSSIEGT